MAYYRVKDLNLAAYLYSQKALLSTVEREGGTCWFIFEENEALKEQVNKYWAGSAVGNINSFVDSVRRLKDYIFGQR